MIFAPDSMTLHKTILFGIPFLFRSIAVIGLIFLKPCHCYLFIKKRWFWYFSLFSTVLTYLLAGSVAGMGGWKSTNNSRYIGIGSIELAPTQSYTLFIVAFTRNIRLIVSFHAWRTERTIWSYAKVGSGGNLRFRILWSFNPSSSFVYIFDASDCKVVNSSSFCLSVSSDSSNNLSHSSFWMDLSIEPLMSVWTGKSTSLSSSSMVLAAAGKTSFLKLGFDILKSLSISLGTNSGDSQPTRSTAKSRTFWFADFFLVRR